jgi:hypothetical protein
MTCATCKFWDPKSKVIMARHDWSPPPYGVGACDCPSFAYVGRGHVMKRDGLGYWDAECWGAGLQTGPDFGCVHWCAK